MFPFEDFRLASCQASLFTPDEEVSGTKIVKGLLPGWVERFDAEPMLLPALDGLPPTVPRVILESKSKVWRCEIASTRINLFWRKPSLDTPDLSLDKFSSEATSLLNEYKEFQSTRVGRMAAVLNRYAPHSSPGFFLSRHFCQERWLTGPLNRPEHFELHSHKRFPLAGHFQVNSWVRSKTGNLIFGEETQQAILVEQDFNTLAEEAATRDFAKDDIASFFSASANEFDAVLGLYYPVEGDDHAS